VRVHRLGDKLQKSVSRYIPRPSSDPDFYFWSLKHEIASSGIRPLLLPPEQRGRCAFSPLFHTKCQGFFLYTPSGLEVFSRFTLNFDQLNTYICELGSVKILKASRQ